MITPSTNRIRHGRGGETIPQFFANDRCGQMVMMAIMMCNTDVKDNNNTSGDRHNEGGPPFTSYGSFCLAWRLHATRPCNVSVAWAGQRLAGRRGRAMGRGQAHVPFCIRTRLAAAPFVSLPNTII